MTALRKLRSLGFVATLRRLSPRRVDQLLYVADAPLPELATPAGVVIERFGPAHPSGIAAVDRKLSSRRLCYIAFVDGQPAHQSWVIRDALLPGQFGMDPQAPVIGECATPTAYRGQGLYPRTLIRIVNDWFGEGGGRPMYVLVAPDNGPSIRGIERAGFRRAARLRGYRVLGIMVRRQRTMASYG